MKQIIIITLLLVAQFGVAQTVESETAYLDAILERGGPATPERIQELDLIGPGGVPDGQVDVRDLAVFFDGLPVSASFGSAESIAFGTTNSTVLVTLPIYLSKPIGTAAVLNFDLDGSALVSGPNRDITLLQSQINLGADDVYAELPILINPWRGFGGEKVVRISLQHDPAVIPRAGTFPSHLLRLRQFDAGEFSGLLTFPPDSDLPVLVVPVGLSADGQAICGFSDSSSVLGELLAYTWNPGYLGFPNLLGVADVVIFKETSEWDTDMLASLSLQRMAEPYPEDLEAYLEGFPEEDQPAVYHADLIISELFAADAASADSANDFAITYHGRLVIQPERYEDEP